MTFNIFTSLLQQLIKIITYISKFKAQKKNYLNILWENDYNL